MKTLTTLAIALCSTMTLATAQPKAGAPAAPAAAKPAAPAAAPAATKPAPAATPASAPAKPTEPMAMPKPPAEIAAALKTMGGTWKCSGTVAGPDGQMAKSTATIKTKSDLDGWWIQDQLEGAMGKMKYKFTAYSTYDAASKKWRRLFVDSNGGQMIGTSDGLKDGKVDYTLDMMGPMGSSQFRDHTDVTDPKAVKISGQMSMDKGKTWLPVYDMTCKK